MLTVKSNFKFVLFASLLCTTLLAQSVSIIDIINNGKSDDEVAGKLEKIFQSDEKFDVDEKNKDGDTTLIIAVRKDYGKTVKLLLDKNTRVNEKGVNGETALIITASKPLEKNKNIALNIANLLIKRHANVNEKDDKGRTPLMMSTWNPQGHEDMIKLLLDNGAKINEKDNEGETPLIWYAELSSIMFYFPNITTLLLNNGAQVNDHQNNGKTALSRSIQGVLGTSNWKLMKDLVEMGKADVNASNNIALYTALNKPNRSQYIIDYLISHGAILNNAIDRYGETEWIKKQDQSFVQELIEKNKNKILKKVYAAQLPYADGLWISSYVKAYDTKDQTFWEQGILNLGDKNLKDIYDAATKLDINPLTRLIEKKLN